MPIVWTDNQGRVCVTRLDCKYVERNRRPGETTGNVVLRLAAEVKTKLPNLQGSTPVLYRSEDMPKDRMLRTEWKLSEAGITDSKGVLLEKRGAEIVSDPRSLPVRP